MLKPKLSVITVVYNDVHHVERTMHSVFNQTYPNIEYLIIDGGSSDGTLEILKQYESQIAKFITEKDEGIYDAMNKGLALASGDYVLFMNSGDEMYAPDTVEQIFASQADADIYYGETEIYSKNWQRLGQRRHKAPEKFTWKSFKYGMNICHQAIYIKRSLVQSYDLKYHLSADIDWIIKAAKQAKHIVNTKQYVAKYLSGGMSKKRHFQSLKERFQIFSKHYGLIPTVMNHGIIGLRLVFYLVRYGSTND